MTSNAVRAFIDPEAIAHNVRELKTRCDDRCRFMAVVKADGYGHGAVETARTALDAGAEWLGVARLHEAVHLRQAGIDAPILIFGYIEKQQAQSLVDLNLTPTAYNPAMARNFSTLAAEKDTRLTIHLKVDTGMGRVGMLWEDAAQETRQIAKFDRITIGGVYTHFAAADGCTPDDRAYTKTQIDRFDRYLARLTDMGIDYGMAHAANSAGIIAWDRAHYDMVRAGISLYGLYPSPDLFKETGMVLQPAMTLRSFISSVRTVPKGFSVSYGMTCRTKNRTRLASVPVGYADGYSRHLSNCGFMLVNGKRAPILGRVCMDQSIIDVGHIEGVKPGDDVVIIGRQGGETVSADELAQLTGTINYEVVSSLTSRVVRIYR